MRNYYDELEVIRTASKEVIEKVYKVLAKKYHPDTTKELDKQAAEEKFKAISEAYEILSDDEKRKKYDLELEQTSPIISYEEYINVVKQRDALSHSLNNLKNEFNQFRNYNNNNQQYYNNSQTQYNQVNSNFGNNYYKPNQNNYNPNTTANSKKKTYYYTNTRKPASAFDYFKYKAKEFFTSLIILLLSIVLSIFIVAMFTNFNFLSFIIK